MKKQKIKLIVDIPILPGNAFISRIKCGKKNCRCYTDVSKRHKIYQWSGIINGKNTTRTLNKDKYVECKKRIRNYKRLKNEFNKELRKAIEDAPWK